MAIEDGIVLRVQPSSGDSTLIDLISGTAFTGAATTLATTVGGEAAVRVHSGTLSGSLDVPFVVAASNNGEGVTHLIRYKLNSQSGGSFDKLLVVAASISDSGPMLTIGRGGGDDVRCRVDGTKASLTIADSGVADGVVTIVAQMEMLSGFDISRIWKNQSPVAPNRLPDYSNNSSNFGTRTINLVELLMATGADIEILDYIIWNRPTTQVESSDAADDVRAVLPIPSGPVPTGTTTVTSAVPTETTVVVTHSYDAADETGYKYSLDGGGLVDVGTTNPFTITGLTADTTYTVEVLAYNANGDGTLSSPATGFTTDAIPVVTLDIIGVSNDTGQLLLNETGITAHINLASDNSLIATITGLSTDASGDIIGVTHASLTAATEYRVTVIMSNLVEGTDKVNS